MRLPFKKRAMKKIEFFSPKKKLKKPFFEKTFFPRFCFKKAKPSFSPKVIFHAQKLFFEKSREVFFSGQKIILKKSQFGGGVQFHPGKNFRGKGKIFQKP